MNWWPSACQLDDGDNDDDDDDDIKGGVHKLLFRIESSVL